MKVSVIVPVYNVEKYLTRCLDSLINQTYKDYEIICINDCSTDDCGSILSEYAAKHPSKIHVITNEKNLGLGLTRERGLQTAVGEFILFVDSDDYVKPDYIQTYCDALEDNENKQVDMVVGGYIRDVSGKLSAHYPSDSVWSTVTYALACTKLIRKAFIEDNGLCFTDIACGEDIYFSLSAFYSGARYKVIPYAGYYYYFNRDSITGSMTYEKNHERLMSELFTIFLDKHDISKLPEQKQRVIEYTYVANMINALAVFNRKCGIKRMRSKYDFVLNDLNEKFPDYRNNPYFGIFKPEGQTLKIRLGVGITTALEKVHLSRAMFYLVSMV